MEDNDVLGQIRAHLEALTTSSTGRPVGSAANQAAEAYIANILRQAGYDVEQQRFECVDWQLDGVELWLGDGPLPVRANPYSPPGDATASLVIAGSLNELERAELTGKIALLHGELTPSYLFPKNYPFFNVEEHQRIIQLLETGAPRAVIMVSHHSGDPSPLIEDGDFTIPSVTVSADVGAVLMDAGEPVTVRVQSTSRPGYGANVIGRRAQQAREKVVLTAHFDTKPGTPGALDNAAGVAAILALAGKLAAADFSTNLEVVAFNGEDHYAAPGEIAYINGCGGEFGRIALLINIDGVGLKDEQSTVAFFNTDPEWTATVRTRINQNPHISETDPWPEGDHTIFAMRGIPCLALTSSGIHAIIEKIIHTPQDTLDIVEPEPIAATVEFLYHLLLETQPPLVSRPET